MCWERERLASSSLHHGWIAANVAWMIRRVLISTSAVAVAGSACLFSCLWAFKTIIKHWLLVFSSFTLFGTIWRILIEEGLKNGLSLEHRLAHGSNTQMLNAGLKNSVLLLTAYGKIILEWCQSYMICRTAIPLPVLL